MASSLHYIKFTNILGFIGKQEVSLQPYTAIWCAFEQGKSDFIKALNFGLGASLEEIGFNSVNDLISKHLCPNEVTRAFHCGVELRVIDSAGDSWSLQRFIADNNVVNFVNGDETDHHVYLEICRKIFNLRDDLHQLTFYLSASDLWSLMCEGEESEVEKFFITSFRRNQYLGDDIKQKKKELTQLKLSAKILKEKHYLQMKQDNSEVCRIIEHFDNFLSLYESFNKEAVLRLKNEEVELSAQEISAIYEPSTSLLESQPFTFTTEWEKSFVATLDMENRLREQKLHIDLLLETYYYKINFMIKKYPYRTNIMSDHITLLKSMLKDKEDELTSWKNGNEQLIQKIKVLENDYVDDKIALQEIKQIFLKRRRLSSYGRFCDLLHMGKHEGLLKLALGDLFYANIVDNWDDALRILKSLKCLFSERETFIVLDSYRHELRYTLFESDGEGITIQTELEAQVFLGKLKEFELIDEIPIIANFGSLCSDGFDFENINSVTLFVESGQYVTAEGIFGTFEREGVTDTLKYENWQDLLKNTNNNLQEQELNYVMMKYLYCHSLNLLEDMQYLSEIIRKCEESIKEEESNSGSADALIITHFTYNLPSIYDEYITFFSTAEQQDLAKELATPSKRDENLEAYDDEINRLYEDIKNKEALWKEYIFEYVKELKKCVNTDKTLFENYSICAPYIKPDIPVDRSKMSFTLQLKQLGKMIELHDLEDLRGGKEWRSEVISSLCKDLKSTTEMAETCEQELNNLLETREEFHRDFFKFTNHKVTNHLKAIIGPVFNEFKLALDSTNIYPMLRVLEHFRSFNNFNTFIKTAVLLSLATVCCDFFNVPIFLIDDVNKLLPIIKDNLDEYILNNVWCANLDPEGQLYFIRQRIFQHLKCLTETTSEEGDGIRQVINFVSGSSVDLNQHHIAILPRVHETNKIVFKIFEVNLP